MLSGKMFDVEHTFNLYALSYVTVPAEGLYDAERLKEHAELIKDCHIYIVGFVPKIDLKNMTQNGTKLTMSFESLGNPYDLVFEIPDGLNLIWKDEMWLLEKDGLFASPPDEQLCCLKLHEQYGTGQFLVKYIGQVFGKDGSRNALDRLMKHEKLQEIAIKGAPPGHKLQILMVEIAPGNKIITVFNPRAAHTSKGDERINQGLDKLYGTDEKERVSLYEAALIRYFMPAYNLEFKDSFPSTNLKILQDCYAKDFAGVTAEIGFDEFPFTLYSDKVRAKDHHIAHFDLHDDIARKVFFSEA